MIAKLRLEPLEHPPHFNVYLDDLNISQHVRRVKIDVTAGEMPRVWLEILAIPQIVLPEALLKKLEGEE